MPTSSIIRKYTAPIFLFALASFIQIQVPLFQTEDYLGLRFNLADLILPFAGMFIVYSLLRKQSFWPQWSMKYTWAWLTVISLTMTLALLKGYWVNGFWSQWALINKYCGFFVLLSYFLMGGWLSSNFKNKDISTRQFSAFFCYIALSVLVLSALVAITELLIETPLKISDFPWDGFMGNRNAYMALIVAVIVILEVFRFSRQKLLPDWAHALLWIIMPIFALYNESRTGWIVLTLILIGLSFSNWRLILYKIMPCVIIGSCISYVMFTNTNIDLFKKGWHMQRISGHVAYSQNVRKASLEDGLELYTKSNPIIGSGLGTYQEFQKEKRGKFIDIMDFSALWLLVETGALGLLAFSGFFITAAYDLYKKSAINSDIFSRSVFFVLILMGAMSFLHELLYTRYLWLFLGLALAQKKTNYP